MVRYFSGRHKKEILMKRPNTSVTEALTPFTIALIANFSKVISFIDFETDQHCHLVQQSVS